MASNALTLFENIDEAVQFGTFGKCQTTTKLKPKSDHTKMNDSN